MFLTVYCRTIVRLKTCIDNLNDSDTINVSRHCNTTNKAVLDISSPPTYFQFVFVHITIDSHFLVARGMDETLGTWSLI